MEKLNLSIGPVMMEDKILELGSSQIPYFRTNEFSNLMLENESLLKKLVNAPDDSRSIFITGSGTAAMEASVINLFNEKDKLLIINGGTFGNRFTEICDIHNYNYKSIELNFQEQITIEHLKEYNNQNYTGFLINIHETSTGLLYDIEIVKNFCKSNNILLVVDAISSFLADYFNMSQYGINTTILSSQKALALPPGISIIILDKKSIERINKNRATSYYFNLKSYLSNGERGQTPFTPAVTILIQLNMRLKQIIEKDINNLIKEISNKSVYFREKISNLPLKFMKQNSSNAITLIKTPPHINATKLCEILKNNYNIYVNPNGGSIGKEVFRVGHMGNISNKDIDKLVIALEEIISNYKE